MTAEAVQETEAPKEAPIQVAESTVQTGVDTAAQFQRLVQDVRLAEPVTSFRAASLPTELQMNTEALYRGDTLGNNIRGRITPTPGDRRGIGPDGRPLPPGEARTDAMRAVEKGEKVEPPPRDRQAAIDSYVQVLEASGVRDARRVAEQTYDRMAARFKDMPAGDNQPPMGAEAADLRAREQMARMTRAMTEMLTGNRGAGDPLGSSERQLLVADLALRMSDPERFANQGAHNTCALQTLQKQMMEGGDPARFAEHLANIANLGRTTVIDRNGQERTVNIDSRGLVPDAEAREHPQDKIEGNLVRDGRGMAGLLGDAFLGQLAADLRSPGSIYMAANARGLDVPGTRGNTDEGTFRNVGGRLVWEHNSPMMTCADTARVSWAVGLPPGSAFIHNSLEGDLAGLPAHIRNQYTVFNSAADLHAKLTAFQTRYGMSGELTVNAPFLPGGGARGHGMHSVNIRANALGPDGRVTFNLDNNWQTGRDLANLSAGQLLFATDRNRWVPGSTPPEGDHINPSLDGGRVPIDQVTPGRAPGLSDHYAGNDPRHVETERPDRDTAEQYRKRVQELKDAAQKEAERQLQTLKDQQAQRGGAVPEQTRQLMEQLQQDIHDYNEAQQRFQRLYQVWQGNDYSGNAPNFNAILYGIRQERR